MALQKCAKCPKNITIELGKKTPSRCKDCIAKRSASERMARETKKAKNYLINAENKNVENSNVDINNNNAEAQHTKEAREDADEVKAQHEDAVSQAVIVMNVTETAQQEENRIAKENFAAQMSTRIMQSISDVKIAFDNFDAVATSTATTNISSSSSKTFEESNDEDKITDHMQLCARDKMHPKDLAQFLAFQLDSALKKNVVLLENTKLELENELLKIVTYESFNLISELERISPPILLKTSNDITIMSDSCRFAFPSEMIDRGDPGSKKISRLKISIYDIQTQNNMLEVSFNNAKLIYGLENDIYQLPPQREFLIGEKSAQRLYYNNCICNSCSMKRPLMNFLGPMTISNHDKNNVLTSIYSKQIPKFLPIAIRHPTASNSLCAMIFRNGSKLRTKREAVENSSVLLDFQNKIEISNGYGLGLDFPFDLDPLTVPLFTWIKYSTVASSDAKFSYDTNTTVPELQIHISSRNKYGQGCFIKVFGSIYENMPGEILLKIPSCISLVQAFEPLFLSDDDDEDNENLIRTERKFEQKKKFSMKETQFTEHEKKTIIKNKNVTEIFTSKTRTTQEIRKEIFESWSLKRVTTKKFLKKWNNFQEELQGLKTHIRLVGKRRHNIEDVFTDENVRKIHSKLDEIQDEIKHLKNSQLKMEKEIVEAKLSFLKIDINQFINYDIMTMNKFDLEKNHAVAVEFAAVTGQKIEGNVLVLKNNSEIVLNRDWKSTILKDKYDLSVLNDEKEYFVNFKTVNILQDQNIVFSETLNRLLDKQKLLESQVNFQRRGLMIEKQALISKLKNY